MGLMASSLPAGMLQKLSQGGVGLRARQDPPHHTNQQMWSSHVRPAGLLGGLPLSKQLRRLHQAGLGVSPALPRPLCCPCHITDHSVLVSKALSPTSWGSRILLIDRHRERSGLVSE